MSASGYLGDRHPGQWTPFWQKACAADKRDACLNLYFLQDGFCEDGSGWACNEIGILLAEHYANPHARGDVVRARVHAAVLRRLRQRARASRRAACSATTRRRRADYRFILRGSKGPIRDR